MKEKSNYYLHSHGSRRKPTKVGVPVFCVK